jgi:hypothetical protein
MHRILITGSREWSNRDLIREALMTHAGEDATEHPENTVLIHGANPRGADTLGAQEAEKLGYTIEAYPADWRRGKVAGNLRNQDMVDTGADVCLAFPTSSSRGTWDCVRRAKAAGIEVVIIREQSEQTEHDVVAARAIRRAAVEGTQDRGHAIYDDAGPEELGEESLTRGKQEPESPSPDLFSQFGVDPLR